MTNASVVVATIHVDASSLLLGSSGTVTGRVYLQLGNLAFPDRQWSDFPVAILAWWLEGLHELRQSNTSIAQCYFMDGPFRFEVSRANTHWRLEALETDQPQHVEIVAPDSFWVSLVTAAREIFHACEQRGWSSRDILKLSQVLRTVAPERAA